MGESVISESTAQAGAGLAERYARLLSEKRFEEIAALLADDVEFRAVTPRRTWQADSSAETVAILQTMFPPEERIVAVEKIESERFSDRERVGYRFRTDGPEGASQVEQQAFMADRDGRIAWIRAACSGYRPAAG